jgi:hypothetical protein
MLQIFVTPRQLLVCWCKSPFLIWVRAVVYNRCWSSPAQSSSVRVTLDSWPYFTVSYSRLPQIWWARSPYLPPGTMWPKYISRHLVPFSLPPTTRRDMVEVMESASTQGHFKENTISYTRTTIIALFVCVYCEHLSIEILLQYISIF